MHIIKKIFFFGFLVTCPFLFSCETEDGDAGEVCEICDSHCCEQVGTEDCCCSGM